jgi:hypothetical protein
MEADVDRHAEGDVEDVGLEQGAEAGCGIDVGKSVQQPAAPFPVLWQTDLDKATKDACAHLKLECIDWAPPSWPMAMGIGCRRCRSGWLWDVGGRCWWLRYVG